MYLGGWWLTLLAVAVGLIALHEFYSIARPLRPLVLAGYLGLILALIGAKTGGIEWLLGGFASTFVLAFVLFGVAETRAAATTSLGATVLGAAWVGLGLGHLVLLRGLPEHGRLAALTVIVAVFAGDTAAYVVGRLVGRHRMAPTLSPGKTWEGLAAGTATTIFVAFIALYKQDFLSIPESIALGGAVAVAAPLGDLFESAIKRDLNVKDTGRLLAGHGGMLDRIDAQLFAAAAAYYAIRALL
ncbi:MAG: phosphatidate cytidylyltransferase [Actinomycetota bacterium]|nr:phosphatidate cytidylyltransferase [Actinomycetota bacterium]